MPQVEKKVKKEVKKEVKGSVKKAAAVKGVTIKLLGLSGLEAGERALPKEFLLRQVNTALLAQYMRVYQANRRKGTASTKTRGEVVGSTKKIYRQKGTGKARHGDIKAPIFVGGGVVGGPKPKEYELKMNKKQKKQSLREAFSLKLKEKNVFGLTDEFLTIEPKTKRMAQFLKSAKLDKQSVLIVLPKEESQNLARAVRNIATVRFEKAMTVNPYSLLTVRSVLIADKAIPDVIRRLTK